MQHMIKGAAIAAAALTVLMGAGCSGTDGDTDTGTGSGGAGASSQGGSGAGGSGGSGATSGNGGSGGSGAGGSGGTAATGGSGGSGGGGLDPTGSFFVRIIQVDVDEHDASGSAWDALGGLPDPFVCGGVGNEMGCTVACDDSTSCAFQDGTLMASDGTRLLLKGSELTSGLNIEVWDEDLSEHDFLGGTVMIITTLRPGYTTGAFQSVTQVRFELY